ncbi:WcbI family polysaccharide biosynthesis putative acetyltransferase [Pseudodesulfovibrio tunisiensis]|uniref:WcbI family polysaccharide biosynthesis putative acetyltransferase n=1 Tax=Pseudodesulfovibrio tunisiensis TaxID=463192 RepID=UPI001FB3B0D2|nr:WcbI family polysaccharide biosynthesis putative acetyltransferase [Pseudodesulfovibrio tunisiensis]
MNRRLCIVHANCQGQPLMDRLHLSRDFREQFACQLFTNYIREPIPAHALGRCSLFLYQHLGSEWGELASARLMAQLPDSATRLCVPNMFFSGYWPLWSGEKGFDYRDRYLDSLVDAGLTPEEILVLYLRSDPGTKYDLNALLRESIDREHTRESRTPIKYLDLILERYRTERLFNTVNHPGPMLMNHAATGVLAELGMDLPDLDALAALGDPFPEFEQPVHPRIAEHMGYGFATAQTRYMVYGRRMTFAQYTAAYVEARLAGVTDFIGHLQGGSS